MKIVGIHKNSTVDYPGKLSAVAFTPGCNMNCFYCHNRSIICEDGQKNLIDPNEFLNILKKRKNFLEGVVISGGEPTIQADLDDYIFRIKQMGYPVKLDTNGTNPRVIKELFNKRLIDYIAMDIKAPFDKYPQVCGADIPMQNIEESIAFIMAGEIDYEFRTTFVPQLSEKDGINIAKKIKGAKKYVLQQYRRPEVDGDFFDYRLLESPHSSDIMRGFSEQIRAYVQNFELRGIS